MRRRGAVLAPLLAVPAMVLIAGCGSTGLSDIQVRDRAAALCATATRQTDRIDPPHAPAQGAAFLTRGIAVFNPELARLRSLRPPADLAGNYTTSVDAFSRELADLELAVHSLHAGEDPVLAIRTLQRRLCPIESTQDRAWGALQVPTCLDG
jgi:hypothetical protein